jgi:hypothetical protein
VPAAISEPLGGAVSVGAIASKVNPPSGQAQPQLLIGTVVASPAPTADRVSVRIYDGVDPIRLPYQTGYVPVADDLVNVLLLGSGNNSGIVLGGRQGQSGNLIVNGNFYRAPALKIPVVNYPPYHWSRYVASGTASPVCQIAHQTYQRLGMIISTPSGAAGSDTSAYSSPFPVVSNANYDFIAFGHLRTFTNSSATVESRIAWFADSAGDYPNFISEVSLGSDTKGASIDWDQYHYGTAVIPPAGATYARMVLRLSFISSGAGSGANCYWFEAIALRN